MAGLIRTCEVQNTPPFSAQHASRTQTGLFLSGRLFLFTQLPTHRHFFPCHSLLLSPSPSPSLPPSRLHSFSLSLIHRRWSLGRCESSHHHISHLRERAETSGVLAFMFTPQPLHYRPAARFYRARPRAFDFHLGQRSNWLPASAPPV